MGSPFASRTVATLPIPFDPPHEVTLQKLAGRHLEKAETAAQAKWIQTMDAKGGVKKQREILKAFKDEEDDKPKSDTPEPEPEKESVDPLAGLDPYTVCRFGIKSWTYDESLKEEPDPETDSMRVRAIDDLGPDELKWFATEVMRLTKPRLFQTKDQHKEAEKNDSAASLTH